MALTVHDIEVKEFTIVNAKGYDRQEVDIFLDEIMDEMDFRAEETKKLQEKLANMMAEERNRPAVAPAPVAASNADAERRVMEMMEMAVRMKDEMIAKARQEAEEIRNNVKPGENETVQKLQDEKIALEKEISNLKETAKAYREQFEALLAAQQEALEKASNLF